MKVKIAIPANAAGLIDPIARRSLFMDADGKLVEIADVPDNIFWRRRVLAGEVTLVVDAPTGAEPIAPLTTRGSKS